MRGSGDHLAAPMTEGSFHELLYELLGVFAFEAGVWATVKYEP